MTAEIAILNSNAVALAADSAVTVGREAGDELGGMAESLVNLTKFKRRISRQQETVGGPIDVAVITKGDGFVWTKRKHYFKPELNPRYITRITRGDAS